jgi:hypothetical protein
LYEFNAATFVLILIIYSSLKFCVVPGILASSSNLFWLYEHLSSNTSAYSVASNGVLVTITKYIPFFEEITIAIIPCHTRVHGVGKINTICCSKDKIKINVATIWKPKHKLMIVNL